MKRSLRLHRRKLHLRVRRYLWLFGCKLPSHPGPFRRENEVSRLLLYCRKERSDLLQWWHASIIWSVFLNLINSCLNRYRQLYYWPASLVESGTPEQQLLLFRRTSRFHILRRVLFIVFVGLVFIQYSYLNPSLSGGFSLALHAVICVLFVFLLIDNLFCQWADLSTFLQVGNMTLVSVLLCRHSFRDSMWEFRKQYLAGTFGPTHDLQCVYNDAKFKSRLEEHLEEVRAGRVYMKGEVFRFAVLPLRHIFGLLVIWGFMIMSLQVTCSGEAFSRLHLEAEANRGASSFMGDMVDCIYFSSISAATIGYGEISPMAAEDSDVMKDRNSILKWTRYVRGWTVLSTAMLIITILGTFNLVFRSVDQVMVGLQDLTRVSDAIKAFVVGVWPYPLTY